MRHVQNFTDIDDKIINRANAEGIDPRRADGALIAEWHAQMRALNVLPAPHLSARDRGGRPDHRDDRGSDRARATPTRSTATSITGSARSQDYGKLSHRDLDDLLSGARIEVDERKEDPLDFALWKAAKPGEPSWGARGARGGPAGTSSARR